MKEFNLVYWHRTTGKKLLAKKVTADEYCLLDPDTKVKQTLTQYNLGKEHYPDPQNRLAGRRKNTIRKGMKTTSKAFQDYLDGRTA